MIPNHRGPCGGGGGGGGGEGEGLRVNALLRPANFIPGLDATLNSEMHKKSVRIKASNSVNVKQIKSKVNQGKCREYLDRSYN